MTDRQTDRRTDRQTPAPFHDMATRSGPHNNSTTTKWCMIHPIVPFAVILSDLSLSFQGHGVICMSIHYIT